MWMILAFWLLLPLPGLACLCRFDSERLADGALSVLARSCLVSLALLTPVSILGYVVHWPLAALSTAYVLLVAGSVGVLARDRSWLRVFREPSLIATLGSAWLLFDLTLAARAGSHVMGDVGFHIGRIRMLLELGLGSWDPLVAGRQFEPIYHTNLYHALIASSAQLASVDPGAAWIWVWPFTKLMLAASAYELALQTLATRWPAWLAAIAAGSWFATQSTLPYPNTLAAFAWVPLGLAMAIAAASGRPRFRNAAWLAAASLVLAQTHALYALFLLLAVAPVLLLRALWAVVRREAGRAERSAALLGVAMCVPWLIVPALPRLDDLLGSVAHAQAAPAAPQLTGKQRKEAMYIRLGPDRVYIDPRRFFPHNLATYTGVALVVAAAVTRRGAVFAALAVWATLACYFFVPLVCSLLVKMMGAGWILARFTKLFEAMGIALVPACTALVLLHVGRALAPAAPRWRWPGRIALGLLQLLAATAALAYGDRFGSRAEPWSLPTILSAAQSNEAQKKVDRITARAAFFAQHVAPEATVMAPLWMDYQLPMHCDCRGLASRSGRGTRNSPDIPARREAATRFYAHETSAHDRRQLLERYKLRYVYSSPRRARRLAADLAPHVLSVRSAGEDAIIELAPTH